MKAMRNDKYSEGQTGRHGRRVVSLFLCLCMTVSLLCNFGGTVLSAEAEATAYALNRLADGDTMDSYNLLSPAWGSRYAGRVWTDKTVFANGDDNGSADWAGNVLSLHTDTDGLDGKVTFDSDFGTVFSALASSQIVNEWPPSPIDLVIVFDMSASMGQDTRYSLDAGVNIFTTHQNSGDSQEWPAEGVLMSDRIENSRIQLTLNAINNTIDKLMEQNPENRVAVCCYGANAVVILPLAHYKHATDSEGNALPYLKVGGMETLYHPGDLVWRDAKELVESTTVAKSGWYWINNRDTAYTVEANALMNENVEPYSMSSLSKIENYTPYETVISNNVKNVGVKAFPGVEDPALIDTAPLAIKTESRNINQNSSKYGAGSADLINAVAPTQELKADDYIGYYTNTQGGIYLAYKQLADSEATTYTDRLSDGKDNTVARIPAAIIMSDGGANFAFNRMGNTVDDWNLRFGAHLPSDKFEENQNAWYIGDDTWGPKLDEHDNYVEDQVHGEGYTVPGREEDYSHRLNDNRGDEWWDVYLPGNDTLTPGKAGRTTVDGKWDGLHTLYNVGADYYQDGTLSSIAAWSRPGVFYNSDGDFQGTPATILEVLLTASYMNQVATKHYTSGWEEGNVSPDSRASMSTYTMNVDTKNLPQWARWRLFPTLDPKDYPPDGLLEKVNAEPERFAHQYGSDVYSPGEDFWADLALGILDAEYVRDLVFKAVEREWGELKTNSYSHQAQGTRDTAYAHMDMREPSKYVYGGEIAVSADEILDNVAYNKDFFDVTSGELDTSFDQILSEITGMVFIPLSGDNDAGVADSITYQDPLGEYMEIKNGAVTTSRQHKGEEPGEPTAYDMALLLFGEMHGLVRVGVYDYQWNDTYMDSHPGEGTHGETPFPTGWYQGDDPKTAVKATHVTSDDTGSYPYQNNDGSKTYKNANEARADGWVMRVDFKTLLSFVPIVNAPEDGLPNNLSEQVKNTKYTLYRFAGTQEDRNKLHRNPIYGDLPAELEAEWEAAYDPTTGQYPTENTIYADTPGVYRLSDIRIWLEHTGDYVDSEGSLTPEAQSNYDDSLYVNIPIAALPTQLAEITIGESGPISYRTNLDQKDQSTPFRVFYAVGLQEDLILRDENGVQTGVDVSKISGEYIQSHTDPETKNIYFLSNWYSGTNYTGYTSDESVYGYSTRGDAAVSISPDAKNRYYLFQKPLPLIAHAFRVLDKDGSVAPVDRSGDEAWGDNGEGNGKTTWETVDGVEQSASSWIGGEFIGTYQDEAAFKTALEKALADPNRLITDAKGYTYNVPAKITDAVITYLDDQLDKVESDGTGAYTDGSLSFSSDDYFFLCIEYYMPIPGTTGVDIDGNEAEGTNAVRKISYMIARKGSAFGSGLHSEHIGNGDMLCWTDINGNCRIELEYNSRTDTGDNTRGQPTFEKLTYTGEELRNYLKGCGLSDEKNIDVVVDAETGETVKKSYLDLDCEYWTNVQNDPHMAALKEQMLDAGDTKERHPEFDRLFDWSVATRTGGIRVGDMFSNVQPKGGNTTIPAGSTYYEGNRTETANNYYIPTLSENSTIGSGLIINNFLGNNGRMEIANATLMATKTLVPPDGFQITDEQEDEVFDYQVFLRDVTGERMAQRIIWNPLSGSWQKRVESLDILTDNSSLLMNANGGRALFCLAADGTPQQVIAATDGSGYYFYADANGNATETVCDHADRLYCIYLPGSEDEANYHLFGSRYEGYTDGDKTTNTEWIPNAGTTAYLPESMKSYVGQTGENKNQKLALEITGNADETKNRPAGSREYWANNGVLIPYNEILEAEAENTPDGDPGTEGIATIALQAVGSKRWDYDEAFTHDNDIPLGQFTLVTVIPDPNGIESVVYSPYGSRTLYMTLPLYFGYKAEELAEHFADHPGETLATCTHDLSDCKLAEKDLYDASPVNDEKDPADIAAHTAYFTMKDGEGILLTGLSASTDYRFTEKLTEDQKNVGFTLKQVEHVQQLGPTTYSGDDARFAGTNGVYSVTGDIGSNTEAVNYTNTIDPDLFVLTKTLVDGTGSEVSTPSSREFTFHVQFTPTGDEAMTDMDTTLHLWRGKKDMTGGKSWTDAAGTVHQMPETAPTLEHYQEFLDTTAPYSLETIEPDEGITDTYTVTVKPGEAVVFYGLIAGTSFSVTEDADPDYPVYGKNPITGTVLRASDNAAAINPATTPNRADFENQVQTGSLTVEKRITDDDAWTVEKTFQFTVTLTAAEGDSLDQSKLDVTKIKTTEGGAESSEPLPVTWDETIVDGKVTTLTAAIDLRHGERFAIGGIPMNTTYVVTESGRDGYHLEYVVDVVHGDPENPDDAVHPTDFGVDGTIDAGNPQASWLFVNAKPPVLPFSGGIGRNLFFGIGGLSLLVSGIVLAGVRRKRRARVK